MIDHQELKKILDQIETSLQEKIDDADLKAGEFKASESYRADMRGFSRGLYRAMHEILDVLRERFPG